MPPSSKVRRTMHVRIKTPGVDAGQLIALAKSAIPFYEAFGGARIRLLRNVDDPSQFIQVVEYEMDERHRAQPAEDRRRPDDAQFICKPGGRCRAPAEFDVYEDVN